MESEGINVVINFGKITCFPRSLIFKTVDVITIKNYG